MEYLTIKNNNAVDHYRFDINIDNKHLAMFLSSDKGKQLLIEYLQLDLEKPWYNLHFDICEDVRTK